MAGATPRRGGGKPCWPCDRPDEGVAWRDDRWLLAGLDAEIGLPFAANLMPKEHLDLGELDDDLAAELGQLIVRIDRAVNGLGGIGRVHVNKWGDGAAHGHVFFLARPEDLLQLRGSNVVLWEEMLPRVPREVVAVGLRSVALALAAKSGQAHVCPPQPSVKRVRTVPAAWEWPPGWFSCPAGQV